MSLMDWNEHRSELKKIRRAEAEIEKRQPLEPSDDWQSFVRDADNVAEWRQTVMTKHLARKAERLNLPLPDRGDKSLWGRVEFDNDPSQPSYLTTKGVLEAMRLIREEQKAKREAVGFWVPIFFGSAGLIIGIISALKHS